MLARLQRRTIGDRCTWGSVNHRGLKGDDPLVDRDAFGLLPGLRRALPDPGGLFATLQRIIDATRAVFQVDGASRVW